MLQDPVWERSGHTEKGRDGRRVPLPWSGKEAPFGFGPHGSAPWLPQPAEWRSHTVGAQAGDSDSTLELYRAALRVRRQHPALGDGSLRWLDSPDDVLVFERDPGFVCAVNFGAQPARIEEYGEVLLASRSTGGGSVPGESAIWFQRP